MQRSILAIALIVILAAVGLAVDTPDDGSTKLASVETEPTLLGRTAQNDSRSRESTTTRPPRQDTSTTIRAGDEVDRERPATTTVPTSTTTTVRPSTTTTNAPPASSPTVVAGPIPKTVPYPGGLDKFGGHEVILTCGASTPEFNCDEFGSNYWWDAPYLGTNLPYAPGYAWVDGDRQGYTCAYGFLQDLDTGELIGRWAALLPPDAVAYGKVNDRFMSEGVRYYDGELANEGGQELSDPNKASECHDILSSKIDYDAVNNGPDERPRIGFFNGAGQIVDIRDYSNTTLGSPGKFKLLSASTKEAVVGFYPAQNNKAAITFYYTAMGSGQLGVDFNGTGPYQP